MGDIRPPIAHAMSAFGVAATFTRESLQYPEDAPIATTGIWVSPLEEAQAVGTDFKRRDPRKVFAVARAAVPNVPRGTLVQAPEMEGGTVRTWRVDGFERGVEPDLFRLILVLVE